MAVSRRSPTITAARWILTFGCLLVNGGLGQGLSVSRFFGKLPQRGQAKALPAAGRRYNTCQLPSWLPAAQSVNTTVFLGSAAFSGSQACGMCIAYSTGRRNEEVKYGIVGGWCPTCRTGDLGLSDAAGQFKVTGPVVWAPVQCDTGCVPLIYELAVDGANRHLKLRVLQTRAPLESVTVTSGSESASLELSSDGSWEAPSGSRLLSELPLPDLELTLASVLGGVLHDSVRGSEWDFFGESIFALRSLQQGVDAEFSSIGASEEPSCDGAPVNLFASAAEAPKAPPAATPAATTTPSVPPTPAATEPPQQTPASPSRTPVPAPSAPPAPITPPPPIAPSDPASSPEPTPPGVDKLPEPLVFGPEHIPNFFMAAAASPSFPWALDNN